jgi:serine/threonine protein kinase
MPFQDDLPKDATTKKDAGLATTVGLGTADTADVVIGPYHLGRRLGEGGMGEVWLAEQKDPVRRRVALKLIKSGFVRSRWRGGRYRVFEDRQLWRG